MMLTAIPPQIVQEFTLTNVWRAGLKAFDVARSSDTLQAASFHGSTAPSNQASNAS